jgi:YihY family inner membrane protein
LNDTSLRGGGRRGYPLAARFSWIDLRSRVVSLAKYLTQTEVHTYAFSVAANAILSLFPFIVLMYTVARRVFHSQSMEEVIGNMVRYFLPTGQEFVVKNMSLVANPRGGVKVAAVAMLLISSSGVFLPLEVALNQVWGVTRNRSYLKNQLVATGLALIVCALALGSVTVTAFQRAVLGLIFFGHVDNAVYRLTAEWLLQVSAGFLSVMLFFFIYWILPNRRLPWRAVLPSALVTGLLWELAKLLYMAALPWLDFRGVYGPFATSVGLMLWAFLTGLLMLAGAHYSATGYSLKLVHQADVEADAKSGGEAGEGDNRADA